MGALRGGGSTLSGRNLIINGNFSVSQRTTTANGYTIDRWISDAGGGACSVSRINPGNGLISGNPRYAYVHHQTSAATNNRPRVMQLVEGVNTFAGQPATLSFWACTDSSTFNLDVLLRQHYGTGNASANVDTVVTTVSITSTWKRYSITFAVPSTDGKSIGSSGTDHLGVRFLLPLAFTGKFYLANVQLERGGVATDFEQRDLGTEIAMCQRFYQHIRCDFYGYASNGVGYRAASILPTPMRAIPTLTLTNIGNVNFNSTSGLSAVAGLPGGNMLIVDDRVATGTGAGVYVSETRCDAELLEA